MSTTVSANSAKTNPVLTGREIDKKSTNKAVVLLPVKPEEQPTQQARPLTIDEINDKAERLHVLRTKYQTIKDKRKQLDSFTISHDKNNAQLTLIDAEGLEITTSNPQSIGKLLKDWMCDLNTNLELVEDEMRKELLSLNH